jgi:hypothetical protein
MPICRTCRGEYTHRDCLCPSCGQPLGRGTNICHRCGADTAGKRLCPRCKNDVTAWERENFPLHEFVKRWGALGLLPSFVALGLWILFWVRNAHPLHHPVITLFAVGMAQVVLILIYVKRLFWRERWWASQIYNTKNMPLTIAIASTFVLGSLLGAISFVLYKVWPVVEIWRPWVKAAFAGAYASTYVCFTAALTLVAIQDYMDLLESRVPQPIFVHTDRLLQVVVEAAIQSLSVLNGKEPHQHAVYRKDTNRTYEILEVTRNSEDGGIRVLLYECKRVSRPNGDADTKIKWLERVWHIEADLWGRVRSLEPEALPTSTSRPQTSASTHTLG